VLEPDIAAEIFVLDAPLRLQPIPIRNASAEEYPGSSTATESRPVVSLGFLR
jgi:hypothetical protein